MHARIIFSLTTFLATASCLALETRFQDFTTDPNWSTLGSGQNGNNFGGSASSHAGGDVGEIGGRFTRSNFIRYLADTNLGGGFTIDEAFSASGSFAYTDHNIPDFGNGFTIGHFSQSVANSNNNGTKVGISFSDNSQRQGLWWQGSVYLDGGIPVLTPPLPIPANDVLNWSYDLVPDINGAGDAQFTFNLNGVVSTIHLDTAQQQEIHGSLDSFGMIGSTVGENPQSTWYADMYIDDVNYSVVSNTPPPVATLPTRTEDFDTDPSWSILGNGQNGNDFGWSSTSNAGGAPGESGGRFTRPDFPYHYADTSLGGSFDLDEPFAASGKFDFTGAQHPDFGLGLLIGHFDIEDGSSRIGLTFGNDGNDLWWDGVIELPGIPGVSGPNKTLTDTNVDREWSYSWNPDGGAENAGALTINLSGPGGGTETIELTPEQRAIAAEFNAFGFHGFARSDAFASRFANLFIDDVTYSIAALPLVGDYDNDGTVAQRDLDIVLLFWGENVTAIPIEFSGFQPEGIMDQEELDAVLLNWGATQELGVASVPEPSSPAVIVLSGVLGLLLLLRRNRQ